MMDPWLPKDYKIADNVTIKNLVFANDAWQIYKTTDKQNKRKKIKRIYRIIGGNR